MLTTVLFYLFAAVLVGAAVGVITARNPVHSALFLVLAFFNSAALWLLLEAEFLGIALVLVYVGAVMVLFLFVVMMLDINVAKLREGFAKHAPLGALVAGLMVFEMFQVYLVRVSASRLSWAVRRRPCLPGRPIPRHWGSCCSRSTPMPSSWPAWCWCWPSWPPSR